MSPGTIIELPITSLEIPARTTRKYKIPVILANLLGESKILLSVIEFSPLGVRFQAILSVWFIKKDKGIWMRL